MDDKRLHLDPAAARQLVLVQAIEEADAQGRVLGAAEREQAEREALAASRPSAGGERLDAGTYLRERARRLLALVEMRQPRLAALQDTEAWRSWLAWGLPLVACLLGAAIDRIDNPRQVNMLSPPLLAVLLWNLLVYLVLLAAPLLPGEWRQRSPVAALQRRLAGAGDRGWRTGNLRADVTNTFHQRWFGVTARCQGYWWRQVLHATAAAWAVGLAISIVLGGLVREYRVGWESTLLELPQVHAFLSVLFAPVVALLPFDAFSIAQLERMHFGSAVQPAVGESRHWVWMYLALLALLVAIPRGLLAAWACWRGGQVGRTVTLDLGDGYYRELLARVSPVRVVLALLATDAGARLVLQRVLRQASDQPALRASAPQPAWSVLITEREDELRLLELPAQYELPLPGPQTAAPGWWDKVSRAWKAGDAPQPTDALQRARGVADLLVLAPTGAADLQRHLALARWLGKPACVLARADLEAMRNCVAEAQLPAQVLALQGHTRHWLRDALLRNVLAAQLPASKAAGFARIASAWEERAQARFAQSMRLLARQLLRAAAEVQEVPVGPLSLKRLLSAAERETVQEARQDAMGALVQRLRLAQDHTLEQWLALHGIEEPVGAVLQQHMEQGKFLVQQAVDSPQASMAGAATGAAMGAGIDLMTGGLTLGAAAALGALVGGAAAFTAAHWKNRAAPSGASQIQLGDEMLQNLVEGALLLYLAVVHWGRSGEEDALVTQPSWRAEVVAAVEAARPQLDVLWAAARESSGDSHELQMQMASLLQTTSRQVLERV